MAFHKCRLCLKIGDFCSIFEKDDTVKLSEMVMSFSNVQIHEGDGLSDRVCTSCIENLSTAYLFKLQCERIDNLLRKYPDIQIDKAPTSDYNDFYSKEFHMHSEYGSVQGEKCENDQNLVKDSSLEAQKDYFHDISDETDSDVDSVKCVYCNKSYNNCGGHTCHVTCTIEHNEMQRSGSNETLVAADVRPIIQAPKTVSPGFHIPEYISVSCVLCEEKYDEYDAYVTHLNKCTTNVKVQHYVCPLCHEIFTEKLAYLKHLKVNHFKLEDTVIDAGFDCVDFAPSFEKTRRPKAVRRQIGWSIEDIYQEIECTKIEEKQTPTSSPLKNFFSKLGNE